MEIAARKGGNRPQETGTKRGGREQTSDTTTWDTETKDKPA